MKQYTARLWASLLALSMLLSLAACGGSEMTAATMHLKRAEGRVAVSDGDGKDVPLLDNLGLYSGYGVDTRAKSYAWIDLDDVKLAKLDQKSEVVIEKDGKDLEIEVRSGSVFFNVTQPLEDDETMNISTSTMLIGIRGTCGWVEDNDGLSRVYLLEGSVKCSADGQSVRVYAGEMAELTEDGELTVAEFTARDIPAFVVEEVEEDDGLAQAILEDSGIDVLNPVDPVADALAQYRAIVSQADTYDYDSYADEAEISYLYALVQMGPEDTVPTLLLEQISESFFGYFGYARVFQYDPETGSVHQPDDILMEGVASAGGYRGGLEMMGDGNGIRVMEMYSGTGETTLYRVTLEGDSLVHTVVWEGRFDLMPESITAIAINWYAISETGGLDSWTPGANTPAPQPEPEPPSEPEQPPEPEALPTDGDRIVFTGTINRYTYDELLALQGMSDPNPGPYNVERDWIFHLIVLDNPQDMNLMSGSGDGLRSGTASIIGVFDVDGIDQYNGQHLIFSIDPSRSRWPSDVSAPFGEPRTSDIHVLGPAPSN